MRRGPARPLPHLAAPSRRSAGARGRGLAGGPGARLFSPLLSTFSSITARLLSLPSLLVGCGAARGRAAGGERRGAAAPPAPAARRCPPRSVRAPRCCPGWAGARRVGAGSEAQGGSEPGAASLGTGGASRSHVRGQPRGGRRGPERSRRERAKLLGAGDRSVEPEGEPPKNCKSRTFKDN